MANPRKGRKMAKRGPQKGLGGPSGQPSRAVNFGRGFPDRIMDDMIYGEVIVRAPGTPTDEYQFNLNSTFDPNLTGTGHQPMFRDQLAVIYNKYRVHSVDLRVDYYAGGAPIIGYLACANETTALTSNLYTPLEQNFAQWFLQKDSGANTAKPRTLRQRINLWDLWGKTKQEYLSDDITAANIGSSPVEIMTAKIGAMTSDGSNVAWTFAIQMKMKVEWYDRSTVSAS